MLFNSFEFAIFLPIVFGLYWFILAKNLKLQNLFVLISSYVFYGWWDSRFLILIFLSSFFDFIIGQKIYSSNVERTRRALLGLSLAFNLGMLGVFKYFNFFAQNLSDALSSIGIQNSPYFFSIALPVGISFYTFQTLSYSIDIYRKNLKPTDDWIAFFAFVSFFPQLVAGPIERAKNLLPQFYQLRHFSYAESVKGMRQILWGLFKKVAIANNCALYVDLIFAAPDTYSSPILILGSILFAFQIYCDFSGYSDIAIGTARLFGFNLMQNFAYPYFSRDIAEFWRRWHISLSTWFRDYVYIPLGGSRVTKAKVIRNIFVIFIVSGFWHGANWTFIVWGALNGLYFLPQWIGENNRANVDTIAAHAYLPSLTELVQVLFTFCLTCLAWIFFRAESMSHAIEYIWYILQMRGAEHNSLDLFIGFNRLILLYIVVMIVMEWRNRRQLFGLSQISRYPGVRWSVYIVLSMVIIQYFNSDQEFIYFQF